MEVLFLVKIEKDINIVTFIIKKENNKLKFMYVFKVIKQQ